MIGCGLDRVLAEASALAGRRFGLLCHPASVSSSGDPAHLALAERGAPPAVLFGPEHGFYGVEQDMVPSRDQTDPWTGARIVSLYGDDVTSLRPRTEAFDGLDLLLIDLQDVGARYYTFAATAAYCAEAALGCGCEVWVLDRPNPLGGERIEGNLVEPGFESFVSAFRVPVRHGLTLAELLLLEARRRGWDAEGLRVLSVSGWKRKMMWCDLRRPWVAPSPNLPTFDAAVLYPGCCLIEGTELSEGRGTTRPFQWIGAPDLDPLEVCRDLAAAEPAGVGLLPIYFRPLHQKHAGEVCAGVDIVVREAAAVAPVLLGARLLASLRRTGRERFAWRERPYEFVDEIPAIDLLAGTSRLREALDHAGDTDLDDWIESWSGDERRFREERGEILLYD